MIKNSSGAPVPPKPKPTKSPVEQLRDAICAEIKDRQDAIVREKETQERSRLVVAQHRAAIKDLERGLPRKPRASK